MTESQSGKRDEGLRSVSRYKMWCNATHKHSLLEDENGSLVGYEDYQQLARSTAARIEELQRELAEAKARARTFVREVGEKVDVLEDALRAAGSAVGLTVKGDPGDVEILRMCLGNTAACLGDALATFNKVVGEEVFKNATPSAAAPSEAGKWIPVTERLPDQRQDTIAWCGWCITATYKHAESRTGHDWHTEDGVNPVFGITHWMPLPAAPAPDEGRSE